MLRDVISFVQAILYVRGFLTSLMHTGILTLCHPSSYLLHVEVRGKRVYSVLVYRFMICMCCIYIQQVLRIPVGYVTVEPILYQTVSG